MNGAVLNEGEPFYLLQTVYFQADAEFAEQGLDQVPTRLTAHSRSQLSTPIRGKP